MRALMLDFAMGQTAQTKKPFCKWAIYDPKKKSIIEGYQSFVPSIDGQIPELPFSVDLDMTIEQKKFGGETKNFIVIEGMAKLVPYSVKL